MFGFFFVFLFFNLFIYFILFASFYSFYSFFFSSSLSETVYLLNHLIIHRSIRSKLEVIRGLKKNLHLSVDINQEVALQENVLSPVVNYFFYSLVISRV